MIDKRAFTRISKKALVSFDLIGKGEEVVDEGMARTTDLSIKGLHLELPRSVSVGDRLRLTLNIDGQMVTLTGQVAWSDTKSEHVEVGVKINRVPGQYAEIVERLIRSGPRT